MISSSFSRDMADTVNNKYPEDTERVFLHCRRFVEEKKGLEETLKATVAVQLTTWWGVFSVG